MQDDIFEIRRAQLIRAIDALDAGNKSAFADRVGSSPSYIGRAVSTGKASKRIGERNARKWEKSAKLPHGYFDAPSMIPGGDSPPSLQDKLNDFPPGMREEIEQKLTEMLELFRRKTPPWPPQTDPEEDTGKSGSLDARELRKKLREGGGQP